MTDRLTDEELAAIEARESGLGTAKHGDIAPLYYKLSHDVPRLVAEVRALQVERDAAIESYMMVCSAIGDLGRSLADIKEQSEAALKDAIKIKAKIREQELKQEAADGAE